MKITILGGTGYIGLITGAGLAAAGHKVICADIEESKINALKRGILPIFEAGLKDLMHIAAQKGSLNFTDDIRYAVCESKIIMIAVGTPENKSGETDLSQYMKAIKSIALYAESYKIIVVKSTVPVGTCEASERLLKNNTANESFEFDIVSNPEFLREGSAVMDFIRPDRIVIGSKSKKVSETIKKLYSSFETEIIITSVKEAEMIKYASNAYLASRISYINEISEICEKLGINIKQVIKGMSYDKRIGTHYLSPGPGFGGPCLVKDLKSLIHFASSANANVDFLKAVLGRNNIQLDNILKWILKAVEAFRNPKICILGLSFKAGTADTRNSPALELIARFADLNLTVTAFDPMVHSLPDKIYPNLSIATDLKSAIYGANCAVIMTEWKEFRQIDYREIAELMEYPLILDTRNILDSEKAICSGINYNSIGSPVMNRKSYELSEIKDKTSDKIVV